MTYNEDDQSYTLSTGRTFYAFSGYLSVDGGGATDHLCYGSDGGEGVTEWTAAERQEVAAFMVALWQAWAEAEG